MIFTIFSAYHNCEIAAEYWEIQIDGSERILVKHLTPILNQSLSIKQFLAADEGCYDAIWYHLLLPGTAMVNWKLLLKYNRLPITTDCYSISTKKKSQTIQVLLHQKEQLQ